MARALLDGALRDLRRAALSAVEAYLCWVAFLAVLLASSVEGLTPEMFRWALDTSGGFFMTIYVTVFCLWQFYLSGRDD